MDVCGHDGGGAILALVHPDTPETSHPVSQPGVREIWSGGRRHWVGPRGRCRDLGIGDEWWFPGESNMSNAGPPAVPPEPPQPSSARSTVSSDRLPLRSRSRRRRRRDKLQQRQSLSLMKIGDNFHAGASGARDCPAT